MAYLSNNVRLFPSTNRTKDLSGKLTNEHNFITIVRSLSDKKSFVIDYDETGTTKMLKVVLGGYYFEIDNFEKTGNKWLEIRVENDSSKSSYGSLINYNEDTIVLDGDDNKFYGIEELTAPSINVNDANYTYYSLQVCYYDEDTKVTSIVNKIKFSVDSIEWNTAKKLREEINDKQYNLKTVDTLGDGGLVLDNISGESIKTQKISIEANRLKAINSISNKNVGDYLKPVFVKDGEVVPFDSNSNAGGFNTSEKFKAFTDVYVNEGVITPGQTKFFSEYAPTESEFKTVGAEGDIWYKYSKGE